MLYVIYCILREGEGKKGCLCDEGSQSASSYAKAMITSNKKTSTLEADERAQANQRTRRAATGTRESPIAPAREPTPHLSPWPCNFLAGSRRRSGSVRPARMLFYITWEENLSSRWEEKISAPGCRMPKSEQRFGVCSSTRLVEVEVVAVLPSHAPGSVWQSGFIVV